MSGTASIPKLLEAKVARLARRLRKPPRRILQEAVEEYITRHEPEAVTEAMNRVAGSVDTRPYQGLAGAVRRVLEQTEW